MAFMVCPSLRWSFALILVGILSQSAVAHSANEISRRPNPCSECRELAKIEKRAKAEALNPAVDFAPYCLQAASVVMAMSRKNPKFDEARIERLVSISRVLVPKDPVRSFLSLISPVILANREAIDAKLATLSKQEASYLSAAIDDSLKGPPKPGDDPVTGATATPPPAGTPGVYGK